MATVTLLQISHARASDWQTGDSPDRQTLLRRLLNMMEGFVTGIYQATSMLRAQNAVQASGTAVFSGVVATDTLSINGVVFTAVAAGATGNQFNVGGSDAETAANAAAAINASGTALVSEHVTAAAPTATLTVTAIYAGHAGNAITLEETGGNITVAPRLTGGTSDAPVTTVLGG